MASEVEERKYGIASLFLDSRPSFYGKARTQSWRDKRIPLFSLGPPPGLALQVLGPDLAVRYCIQIGSQE